MARVQTGLDSAVQVVAELCTPRLKGSLRTQCKPNVHTNSPTQLGSRGGSENWSQHALPASKLKNRLLRHANTEIFCVAFLLPPKLYAWSTLLMSLILYSLFLCNLASFHFFLASAPLTASHVSRPSVATLSQVWCPSFRSFLPVLFPSWDSHLPGSGSFLPSSFHPRVGCIPQG